ncbi:MAG: DGQHR domain-containing protein [Thermodesulfobacteriota bacterium]
MKIPCLAFDQGGTKFWLCKVKFKEILGKAIVDQQSPKNPEGYQREAQKNRARKFGHFMRKGGTSPVNLFVNIRENNISEEDGYLNVPDNLNWWIVDGQHRFEGMKELADEFPMIREIDIPIALMNSEKEFEAKQFLIINKMQKGVKTDLAERIFLILEQKEGRENIATQDLPIDMWKSDAVRIIDYLADTPESPLYHLIKRPGEKGSMPLNQVSATSSLKPLVDVYKSYLRDEKQAAKGLMNMWSAIKTLCPEAFVTPKDYLILKTPGIFVLNKVFAKLLPTLWAAKNITGDMFLKLFSHENVSDYFECDFWHKDNSENGASRYGSSQKSYGIIYDLIWDSLKNVLDEIIPEKNTINI